MRKSERLRLLEMEVLRLQFTLEYVTTAIDILTKELQIRTPEMDAGKWYAEKLNDLKKTID